MFDQSVCVQEDLELCINLLRRLAQIREPNGSGFGTIRLDVRHNRVIVSEATVRDHLRAKDEKA
jgi:hypothetical protein